MSADWKVVLSVLVAFSSVSWISTAAKSVPSETYPANSNKDAQKAYQQQYQQQYQLQQQHQLPPNPEQYSPQQHGSYHHQPQSPSYPEYDDNMESYEYPSSEEVMPVKNSEFVPVESSGDANFTDGHVPQRQVNLQQFWQTHMLNQQQQQQNNNEAVTDQGAIEVVSIPQRGQSNYNPAGAGAPLSQYYQEQQGHFYQPNNEKQVAPHPTGVPISSSPLPFPTAVLAAAPKKKSNVHKLIVEARRTGDGKIAVVRDKLKAARQRRSMMTLSREDENESEYDELEDSANNRNNSTIKTKGKERV